MANVQADAQEVVLAKYAPYQEYAPVLANVDMHKTFRTAWLSQGAPAENLIDYDEMIASLEKQKELEEAAAQAQIGESASKAYKNVSGAPEEGSIASQL